jgi:hypothetical protein
VFLLKEPPVIDGPVDQNAKNVPSLCICFDDLHPPVFFTLN